MHILSKGCCQLSCVFCSLLPATGECTRAAEKKRTQFGGGEECRTVREQDCETVEEEHCNTLEEMQCEVIQVSQGSGHTLHYPLNGLRRLTIL